MKKNLHLILVGAAVLLVLASQSLYIVQQPEQAIVLQFGNPVRLIQEPGLKIKMPMQPSLALRLPMSVSAAPICRCKCLRPLMTV